MIHLGQAIRFKLWWLLMTAVIAGIAEIMGWGARLWSSKNPTNITPYLMQYGSSFLICFTLLIIFEEYPQPSLHPRLWWLPTSSS